MIECDNNEEFIIANLSSSIINETLDLAFNEGEKICFKVTVESLREGGRGVRLERQKTEQIKFGTAFAVLPDLPQIKESKTQKDQFCCLK